MPRGRGLISAGGLPEITFIARALGDYSSIKKGVGMAASQRGFTKKNPLRMRVKSRVLGRGAGFITSKAQSWMGLWGLVAVAQGLALVQNLIQVQAAKETWMGSMVNYSQAVERGHAGVVSQPPTYFFSRAIAEASAARFGGSFGKGMFQMPAAGKRGNVITRARTGLYSGQRFIGDFGSLWRGDIASRVVRRETGRQVASFFWGTLSDPKQNILRSYAYDVVRAARRNIRDHSPEPLIDTGALYASLAVSDVSRAMFIENSIRQTAEELQKKGLSRLLRTKIDFGSVGGGGPF